MFGTFLGCLWTLARVYVKAASGRQRLNVSGAWNAATRERIRITNTTVVNTQTMGELLRAIAARQLVGPVTLVLDNARYQRNKVVQALAKELGIELLFLPPVLAKPEPDRAFVGVRQAGGCLWAIPPELRQLPGRGPGDLGWCANDPCRVA